MPIKLDMDATTGTKLLKLFQRLLLDGNKHFQTDLAEWLNCSTQTVARLANEIERVIGTSLQTGMDKHRRWFRIAAPARCSLGLEFEELRYLRICRELATPYLPEQVQKRVDESIFKFSMMMADPAYQEKVQNHGSNFAFFSKGRIDYSSHHSHINSLLKALDESRVCLIRYKAAGSSSCREHRFLPTRIVCMNQALYVLGADLCEDFSCIRHLSNLAVHRIQDVTLTDKFGHFDIPQADPGSFGLPWHEPRRFRIAFTAGRASDYVRERIWADQQKLEEQPDGSVILELTTRSEPELTAWVRSFGEDARLLKEE